MGKLIDKYKGMSDTKKNILILVVIFLIGCLATLPFCFFDNPGVLIGWVAGSLVNIFAYYSIAWGSSYLLSGSGESKRGGGLMAVFSLLRLFLYTAVLVLAGLASFVWGSLSSGYCNLISVAIALMPTWIVTVITSLLRSKRSAS